MKSQVMRSSRLTVNQNRKKKNSSNKLSQSPTLASSYSEKSLWTHSYKNQPFPKELRKKLWGKKFQFDLYSDEEQQISAVVEQQEEGNQKKIKRLPHFKIIADQGQFSSKRNRIKSQIQFRCRQKCKSVESLKFLPQVEQQKKEQDDLKRLQRSKLSYFKDRNQFNQRTRRSSDCHTQIASKAQSLQNMMNQVTSRDLPEQIEQNQAEQTKSVKLPGQRSIITAQIDKIIVDQLDSRRKKQQSKPQQIQEIIEQEKLEEDDENGKVTRLRQSLSKFQTQSQYLKQLGDEEVFGKSVKEIQSDRQNQAQGQKKSSDELKVDQIENQLQGQKDDFEDIRECSSSGKQDDYQDITKLSVINEQTKEEIIQNNILGN